MAQLAGRDQALAEAFVSLAIGAPDTGFDLVTDSRAVAPYLAALPERERAIVIMRFYQDMTQSEIAQRIGISQMHVSRLLSATLARLRDDVISDQPPRGDSIRRSSDGPEPSR